MIQPNSTLIFQAALPVLLVSLSSCASVANYVVTGRLEDPDAQEAKLPVESSSPSAPIEPAAPPVQNDVGPSKPAAEPAMPTSPTDTIPKDDTGLLVDGEAPESHDGCTNADGNIAVYQGMGVQIGKKKRCGISRIIDDSDATLTIDRLVLSFRIRQNPPDIAKERAGADKLRKAAADNHAQLEISVVGDATYTLITARGKTPKGESFGLVESIRTIDGQHFRCQAKLELADVSMLANAKQICSSMKLLK